MMRILDWALHLPETDGAIVLMMGNSAGGMTTIQTAAVDPRITVAVSSCAYNSYFRACGNLRHCPCTYIPGLLRYGEHWDVAGLIAPRFLLTVNGLEDPMHPPAEVERAVTELRRIYRVADAPDRCNHLFGQAGHRFYRDLMWPFIREARQELSGGCTRPKP